MLNKRLRVRLGEKSVKILRLEGKNCKRKAKEIIKAISLSGNYIFSSSSPISPSLACPLSGGDVAGCSKDIFYDYFH